MGQGPKEDANPIMVCHLFPELPDINSAAEAPPIEHDEDESDGEDDIAIDYVPPKNHATVDVMAQRKFLDTRKWYSMRLLMLKLVLKMMDGNLSFELCGSIRTKYF